MAPPLAAYNPITAFSQEDIWIIFSNLPPLAVCKIMKTMKKRLSKEHFIEIGRKGGQSTYRKRGKKFFSFISLKRKKFGGGRPKKKVEDILGE